MTGEGRGTSSKWPRGQAHEEGRKQRYADHGSNYAAEIPLEVLRAQQNVPSKPSKPTLADGRTTKHFEVAHHGADILVTLWRALRAQHF